MNLSSKSEINSSNISYCRTWFWIVPYNGNIINGSELDLCLDDSDAISPSECACIFDVYIVSILCLVGIVGNAFTVAVLRQDVDKHKATNWLLQTLAIVDMIFLALVFIVISIGTLTESTVVPYSVLGKLRVVMRHLWLPLAISDTLTVWIVVVVTVDRYLAICKPMQVNWRSLGRMKKTVLAVFVLAVCYNIPRYFELKVSEIWSNSPERNETVICLTALFMDHYYRAIYMYVGYVFIRTIGPFVVLLILNALIAWELKALNEKRRQMSQQVKEERNITTMLVVVVIIFLVCQLPQAGVSMSDLARMYIPFKIRSKSLICMYYAARALVILNSSINFFIYCLIWRKFNRILFRLIQCSEIENIHEK